jgi:hypothetical protein
MSGVKIGIYRFFYVWSENFYIVEGLKFQNFFGDGQIKGDHLHTQNSGLGMHPN